jgi:nucleotide-binding universal stress UspA family protein
VVSQLFDKILVAVDGSEPAYRALDIAVDLADRYSAEMVIVSVVTPVIYPLISFASTDFPTGVPPIIPAAAVGEYLKGLRAQHEKVLEEALKRAKETKPDLKDSVKLLEGRPADEIIRFAKEERFDIIVMGSRGLGGIKEIFLGSVSDRVADQAACPILIVK